MTHRRNWHTIYCLAKVNGRCRCAMRFAIERPCVYLSKPSVAFVVMLCMEKTTNINAHMDTHTRWLTHWHWREYVEPYSMKYIEYVSIGDDVLATKMWSREINVRATEHCTIDTIWMDGWTVLHLMLIRFGSHITNQLFFPRDIFLRPMKLWWINNANSVESKSNTSDIHGKNVHKTMKQTSSLWVKSGVHLFFASISSQKLFVKLYLVSIVFGVRSDDTPYCPRSNMAI